jgi:hypothetical protein
MTQIDVSKVLDTLDKLEIALRLLQLLFLILDKFVIKAMPLKT